jgi:MraZ protein
MSGYVGSYQHQIDEKGRLSLPAQYRREDPEQTLVLVHVLPNALTLYPEKTWAEVEVRLRDMMRLQPQARPWLLGVMANAVEVVPDKQGRILIPQRLQEAVEIRNTVTLVGMLDRIELYAPEKFAATVTQPVPDADRYAHQVFG